MTKTEFLNDLRKRLSSLPPEEQESAVRYYEEYFNEAGPEREAEILKQLGSAQKLAEDILKGQHFAGTKPPFEESKTAGQKTPRRNNILMLFLILLAVITSPIWLAVGAVLLSVICIGLLIAVGIVLIFAAIGAVLGIVGVSVFVWGIFHCWVLPASGILGLGLGLILFAVSLVLLYLFGLMIGKVLPAVFRGTISLIRRLFFPVRTAI